MQGFHYGVVAYFVGANPLLLLIRQVAEFTQVALIEASLGEIDVIDLRPCADDIRGHRDGNAVADHEAVGITDYATSMADPTYSAKLPTLKLAILHERRSELAFEHYRWFDLLRFFTINDLVTYIHGKNPADWGLAIMRPSWIRNVCIKIRGIRFACFPTRLRHWFGICI